MAVTFTYNLCLGITFLLGTGFVLPRGCVAAPDETRLERGTKIQVEGRFARVSLALRQPDARVRAGDEVPLFTMRLHGDLVEGLADSRNLRLRIFGSYTYTAGNIEDLLNSSDTQKNERVPSTQEIAAILEGNLRDAALLAKVPDALFLLATTGDEERLAQRAGALLERMMDKTSAEVVTDSGRFEVVYELNARGKEAVQKLFQVRDGKK